MDTVRLRMKLTVSVVQFFTLEITLWKAQGAGVPKSNCIDYPKHQKDKAIPPKKAPENKKYLTAKQYEIFIYTQNIQDEPLILVPLFLSFTKFGFTSQFVSHDFLKYQHSSKSICISTVIIILNI